MLTEGFYSQLNNALHEVPPHMAVKVLELTHRIAALMGPADADTTKGVASAVRVVREDSFSCGTQATGQPVAVSLEFSAVNVKVRIAVDREGSVGVKASFEAGPVEFEKAVLDGMKLVEVIGLLKSFGAVGESTKG